MALGCSSLRPGNATSFSLPRGRHRSLPELSILCRLHCLWAGTEFWQSWVPSLSRTPDSGCSCPSDSSFASSISGSPPLTQSLNPGAVPTADALCSPSPWATAPLPAGHGPQQAAVLPTHTTRTVPCEPTSALSELLLHPPPPPLCFLGARTGHHACLCALPLLVAQPLACEAALPTVHGATSLVPPLATSQCSSHYFLTAPDVVDSPCALLPWSPQPFTFLTPAFFSLCFLSKLL